MSTIQLTEQHPKEATGRSDDLFLVLLFWRMLACLSPCWHGSECVCMIPLSKYACFMVLI